uniref:Uncharacterized protein n=1 Tax=viral metagenome TaxID=1070528 RepID=A0A6C0J6H2_9ZZZZ
MYHNYCITHDENYTLTEQDIKYLKSVKLNYNKNKKIIYTTNIIHKYQIERAKGDIRRIPNTKFYDSLNDDFKLMKKCTPIIIPKSKNQL